MVFKKVCALLAEQFSVEESELTLNTSFTEDLHADSLDLVELVMALEEEFDVGEIAETGIDDIKTIGDAVHMIKSITGDE